MDGLKISFAVVAFVIIQGVAVIWYVSKLDSKVEQMYSEFTENNKTEVIENQVRMKLDMASVITDLAELNKELKKMQNKDQTIIKQNNKIERQHKQLFDLIDNNKDQEQKYSYD
jgi:hypothetical protein